MTRTTKLRFAIALIASPATAQTVTSIETARPMPSPAVKGDPDKLICEKVVRTGSRLAVEKLCLTAEQWADKKDGHRHDVEKVQQTIDQDRGRQ